MSSPKILPQVTIRLCLVWSILTCSFLRINGQNIEFLSGEVANYPSFWNVSITHPAIPSQQVKLSASVLDDKLDTLLALESEAFYLRPEGFTLPAQLGIKTANTAINESIEPDNYQVCINLLGANGLGELAKGCYNVFIDLEADSPEESSKTWPSQGNIRLGWIANGISGTQLFQTEAHAKVEVAGLPFMVDFRTMFGPDVPFYPTFNINFDHQKYLSLIREQAVQELVGNKKAPNSSSFEKSRFDAYLDSVRNTDSIELEKDYGKLLSTYPEYKDSRYQPAIIGEEIGKIDKTLSSPAFSGFEGEIDRYQEQLDLNSKDLSAYKDSLFQADYSSYQNLMRFLGRYEAYQKLNAQKMRLEQLRSVDVEVSDYQGRLQELRSLKKKNYGELLQRPEHFSKWLSYHRKLQFLSRLRSFRVGTIYPYQSDIGLNGLAVNGVEAEYQSERWFIRSTVGKALPDLFVADTVSTVPQSSWLTFGEIGLGNRGQRYLSISGSEYRYGDSARQKLVGIAGAYQLFERKLELSAEGQFLPDSLTGPVSHHGTFQLGLKGRVKSWFIQGIYREVGESYRLASNPWLVSGQQLHELNAGFNWWENRFSTELFSEYNSAFNGGGALLNQPVSRTGVGWRYLGRQGLKAGLRYAPRIKFPSTNQGNWHQPLFFESSVTYNKRWPGLISSSQITFYRQEFLEPSVEEGFRSIFMNQVLIFPKIGQVNLNATRQDIGNTKTLIFLSSFNANLTRKAQIGLNLRYLSMNHSSRDLSQWGLQLSAQGVLWGQLRLNGLFGYLWQLQGEGTELNTGVGENISRPGLQGQVGVSWAWR